MTLRQANFEGQNPGTTIGVANSGNFGDSPFDVVNVSGMSLTYGSTAMHGGGGAAFGAAATTQYAILRYGAFSNAKASARVYLRLRTYPTGEFQFMHTMGGTTSLTGFNITPTGIIKVVGTPNASSVLFTSTASLAVGVWYRLEFATAISGTAGQVLFSAYSGDSGTPITGLSYDSGPAISTGTTLITQVDVGKISTTPATGAFDIDDFAVNDGVLLGLGPYANIAPTVQAAVTTGSALIDCTGTTPGQSGDTITYVISPSLGTSQPARGIFLVSQQNSAVTYTVTATESNGQSRTVTALVPGASGTAASTTLPKVYANGIWQ